MSQRRRPAFTLIELLVVISVIALLMAILMPALSRARKQAWFVECRSRLRTVGFAMVMYCEDNDGKIPGGPGAWEWSLRRYIGYQGQGDQVEFMRSMKWPYTCEAGVRVMKVKSDLYRRTFAINRWTTWYKTEDQDGDGRVDRIIPSGDDKGRLHTMSDAKHPSYTLFFVDTGYFFGLRNPQDQRFFGAVDGNSWYLPSFFHYGTEMKDLIAGGTGATGARTAVYTDGRANILFFDGHVEGRRFTEYPMDPGRAPQELFNAGVTSDGWELFWYGGHRK